MQVLLRHRAVEAGATPEDPSPLTNPFGLFSEAQRTGALTSDPDLADLEGKTPLYHAVSIYRMDLAEALMDANDKVCCTEDKKTIHHWHSLCDWRFSIDAVVYLPFRLVHVLLCEYFHI